MRNLKRALSLVLAVVMVIGLMVVGASAVSYNDFSDRGEIVNKDAVSMLTTLGIIEGKPDGSYAPTEGVDRAQMAKMISVIMNQGADNSALYVNSPTGLTDIATNWAKGHINYCYTLGIIAGRGNGTFDPSAGVTGVEAAKMLLVAAGYDPKIEGFEGSDWAINVNAKASALGIFRNFTKDVTAPLNRDDAALLIYNALDVEMIQKYESGYAIAFSDARTILSAMYGVYKVEGVVVGNKWAELDKTDSDEAMKDGKTMLDNVVLYSSTTSNTTKNEGVAQSGKIQFNVDTPVEYLGKTVTLYIEKTTILSDSKVLGVATKDDQNVIQATTGTEDTVKDYLKGTGLSITDDTEFYVNYGYCEKQADATDIINNYLNGKTGEKFNLNGVEVEVIDNNNDGDVDYVLYLQETLGKVNRYSEKNEIISFYAPEYKSGKLTNGTDTITEDFADVVFADDVTSDDLILYVQYGGRTYISLPEVVTGTMTRVDRDKNDELYITVGGETYYQSYILDAASLVDVDVEHFDINAAKTLPGFDTEYDFILDSNGYVVAVRPAEETVTNYALVLDSAWTQNALEVRGQVEILMTDGTEGTYYINWKNSVKKAFGEGNDSALEKYLGTRDVDIHSGFKTGAAAGTVITYTMSDDDILTITSVLGQNDLEAGKLDFVADKNGNQEDSVATGDIVYIADNAAAEKNEVLGSGDKTPNAQYKVGTYADGKWSNAYENGDGYIELTRSGNAGVDETYAIDKNTVAFYYKDADNYGVAIGWDKMSDVKAGTLAQFYPVLKKTDSKTYETTKLAEVVVFNAAPTANTQDWLLVLTANALTSKTLELNVVFEDGTTKAIEVSKEDYEDEFDKKDGYAYMVAYTYSVNSDGTYELNLKSRTEATDVVLLKNGTLDVDGMVKYPTVVDKSNIWDVTDMTSAGEDAAKGEFVVGYEKNAVVITTNEGKVLQTAWIWDKDEVEDPDHSFDMKDLYVTEDPAGTINVYTARTLSARQVANVVKTFLNDADIDEVVYSPADDEAVVTFDDNSKVTYDVFVTTFSSEEDVTMQEVFEDAFAYEYKDGYTYKGVDLKIEGTKVTGTYTSDQLTTGEDVMHDMARLLGALYRAGDAKKIVFDGKTYTWDADNGLKGSNWVDSNDNTLVKAIGIKVGGTVSASTEVELTVDGIDITFAVDVAPTPGV